MADITKPNLPDAGAVDYNSGDIDYLIATDAVYYVNANRPHRNLAHRDNLLESKLDTVIDWLNDSRGSVADLDTRLDVSINEDGTLKTAPDITEIEQNMAAALDSRARMMRVKCPSGWLPPHKQAGANATERGIGYVAEGGSGDSGTTRIGSTGSIFTTVHNSIAAADANTIRFKHEPMKVNVNGYTITLESRPSKTNNTQIVLPAAPTTGARQDLVIIEAWKEEVEPGASDDVLFPLGNVFFDESGTFDGCTLANTDQSGGNYPAYLASSAEHGYYVAADDANIADFIKDERNNVGMTEDGKFFQVRWRITTLSDVDPDITGSLDSYLQDSSGSYFAPQGQLASRPAAGTQTDADGIFAVQNGADTAASTKLDSGMYLGGTFSATSSAMTTVSGLSLDGFVYATPVCVVHRRNSTAWDKAGNMNGAGSISSGTSGRPDDLYYDEVNERDIVDLRHRVCMSDWDYDGLYEETLQQLLKSDLKTNWESYKEDPDGNTSFNDLSIYGTLLLRAEGVKATSFDSSWDVVLRLTCNNGINAKPDSLRNYYSDQPGEQAIFGRIADESSDGAIPTQPFTYTAATHTLAMDATDLQSNDGSHAQRPQWSGRTPDLYWGDAGNKATNVGKGTKAYATFSGLTGDSISAVIEQETYVFLFLSGAFAVGNGDVYQAPNGVNITIDGSRIVQDEISGYFTGSTVPSASGSYTKISGSGPANITVSSIAVGYKIEGWQVSDTSFVYVGEGYDLHSGKPIFITAYLYFKAGSGFLSRVPYDDHSSNYDGLNSIKRTEFRINGTQVLPGDGQDFHPFGMPVDPDVSDNAGIPDSHTKATCLAGFVKRGAVVDIGAEGTYDTIWSYTPCVIKDGSTYKMWYNGFDGSNFRIIYCDSSDGITWSNHQLVVNIGAEGTYDTNDVYTPCVIKDGSTYKMWYGGFDGTNQRIIYCDSSDGITWSNHQMVVNISSEGTYDTLHASHCWVVKDGSTYRMLYSGNDNSQWRIIYADSANGTTWANHQMVVDSDAHGSYDTGSILSPRFIKDNDVYKLWYYGSGAGEVCLYSTSTDCKYWSRPTVLFKAAAEGYYDSLYPINYLSVIKDDSAYKFWASGRVGSNDRIFHGVFSMQDTSNTGSSLVGVYSTTGTDNFAPTADDDVLVYYEARALQQDWSRFGGSLSGGTGTLTHLLKWLPDFAVVSSLGTAGKPAVLEYPESYRDVFSTLLLNPSTSATGEAFAIAGGEPQFGYDDIDSKWLVFKDFLPFTFSNDDDGTLMVSKPRVGDYVSLSSLSLSSVYDIDGVAAYDRDMCAFGSYTNAVFSRITGGSSAYEVILGGIGEKNKELFVPLAAQAVASAGSDQSRLANTAALNLIGRPLVR